MRCMLPPCFPQAGLPGLPGSPPHAAAAASILCSPAAEGDVQTSTLPFQPVRMTFIDMKYSVPLPKARVCTPA